MATLLEDQRDRQHQAPRQVNNRSKASALYHPILRSDRKERGKRSGAPKMRNTHSAVFKKQEFRLGFPEAKNRPKNMKASRLFAFQNNAIMRRLAR